MGRYSISRRRSRGDLTYEGKTYKSKLEVNARKILPESVKYETEKIKYVKEHTYNPDWTVKKNIYIETKGLFTAADRAKHLDIKKQHPSIKIYFIFERPQNKLNRSSKTTYADWCVQHGYEWTTLQDGVPKHWLK